jgi:hypothetical protein
LIAGSGASRGLKHGCTELPSTSQPKHVINSRVRRSSRLSLPAPLEPVDHPNRLGRSQAKPQVGAIAHSSQSSAVKLADLQRAFQSRVLFGASDIESLVACTPQFDAKTRLSIYEDAFPLRLCEALTAIYPALRYALGEAEFFRVTRTFARAFPPTHFSIRYYGGHLASFIALVFTEVRAKVLSEIARWEWALSEAFDAADATPLTQAELAHIEPERWAEIRFQMSPTVRRLTLRSNAVQWWKAAVHGARRPSAWRSARPVHWVLWRSQLTTYFQSLTPEEAAAFDVLADGQPFASVCERLARFSSRDEASMRAALLVQRSLTSGWIVELHAPAGA